MSLKILLVSFSALIGFWHFYPRLFLQPTPALADISGLPCAFTAGCWVRQGSLTSTIFDTRAAAELQSIRWEGTRPTSTAIGFQLASSNSPAGPWNFIGPDGTDSSYYVDEPNTYVTISTQHHLDQRYFQYRVVLKSTSGTTTPTVDRMLIFYAY